MTQPLLSGSDRYAQTAFERECAELANAAVSRNDRLNRSAYALGRFVGAGHLNKSTVEAALFDAATACGYVAKDGAAQAWATIRSGLTRGTMDPRDPPIRDRDGGYATARPAPDPQELARQERAREQQRLAREAEDEGRIERARRIFQEADPEPRGKLPERYLNEHRKLELLSSVCGHTIRFHPAGPWEGERSPMMLSAYRCLYTDKVVGVLRTRLDPVTGQKVGRKLLGRARGAAIKLTPDAEVTMGLTLAEGVESALAGMALGLVPMWAMGGVGGIAAFPVLSGIEALTVCAETGAASETAVEQVGTRWTDAGREVRICRPRHGSDLNDAIKEGRP